MQLGAPQAPTTVPLLREELRLIPAANNHDGSPAWMIQDPIKNQFYRISWLDFELLSRWHMVQIADVVVDVNAETTLNIEPEDVLSLMTFLQQNRLLQASSKQAVQGMIAESQRGKKNVLSMLVHYYLFFRIPIIKPQVWLKNCLPYIRWVFTPGMAAVVFAITFAGLFLAFRQWDTFRATFVDQLTLAGLMSYGVALVFSKCLHELGHAFTATRYGVRVGHMGIAMLVMFPMPYTDTSESWKLSNPKQRLHIASAGIITELALAGIATLAWSITPEGALKSALFFLATTSWVLTLLVNLSPFMRFDGYFIASDLLDFPNLHERSGGQAKTWMRRTLLGFDEPWPEDFSAKKRRALIIFSTITWLYRLTVFIGIAWLVYYFFFKVLGIILFVIELLWFVWLPIWRELQVWWQRRSEIKLSRILMGLGLLGGLVALGLVPWQTQVHGAAWVHATKQSTIFTPTAGKLVSAAKAGKVQAGDQLFVLTSPDIALQVLRAEALSNASSAELRSLSGQDDGEARRAQLQFQQQKFNAEVKLYQDELSRMDLTAPFAGELHDLDENLAAGTWVHPKQPLAVLIDPQSWAADVLVEEAEIARIQTGDKVTVYLQDAYLQKLQGKVVEVDGAKLQVLPNPMLNVQYGGPIATLEGSKDAPRLALYRVRVQFNAQPNLVKMAVGNASIDTKAKAWLPTAFERIAALFIRESGF